MERLGTRQSEDSKTRKRYKVKHSSVQVDAAKVNVEFLQLSHHLCFCSDIVDFQLTLQEPLAGGTLKRYSRQWR